MRLLEGNLLRKALCQQHPVPSVSKGFPSIYANHKLFGFSIDEIGDTRKDSKRDLSLIVLGIKAGSLLGI